MSAINAWAAKIEPGDTRTADQRRADAIVEICLAALAMPGLPKQHGARPAVNITFAATTLAGRDDLPGELDGYGPIPAGIARRWAADPTATRYLWPVDRSGRILDCTITGSMPTSTRYTPPASLARHVITRDQHCVHPGFPRRLRLHWRGDPHCRRAWGCELDHRVPWPNGPTSAENLEPLCERHHMLKHHGTWTVRRDRDGSYEWTSPTRHRYRYRPPERPAPEPEPEPPTDVAEDSPPF